MEKPNSWGFLLALLAAFGFSLKAIFIKLAYPYGVDAITLLALRMGFALPVFLWVGLAGRKAGGSPEPAATRGKLLALGCLGYYGASILDFWGLEYISAGLERLILFTYSDADHPDRRAVPGQSLHPAGKRSPSRCVTPASASRSCMTSTWATRAAC